MATGLEAGDPTNYPASVRYAEDGEAPSSALAFFPPVEDLADRTAYLKARVSGGARSLHGAITTNGAGAITIAGGGGGYTAAVQATLVRITFDSAKTAANYTVVHGAGLLNTGPGYIKVTGKTTAQVDFQFYNTGAALVNPSTAPVNFDFHIIDDEP